jgi:hypothetical protein
MLKPTWFHFLQGYCSFYATTVGCRNSVLFLQCVSIWLCRLTTVYTRWNWTVYILKGTRLHWRPGITLWSRIGLKDVTMKENYAAFSSQVNEGRPRQT